MRRGELNGHDERTNPFPRRFAPWIPLQNLAECQFAKCPAEGYSNPSGSLREGDCQPCPQGRYSDGSQFLIECTECEAGKFADASASGSCLPCGRGAASSPGSSECFECPDDETEDDKSACAVQRCGDNQYASSDGCKDCRTADNAVFLILSVLTFIVGAIYVNKASYNERKMVRIKVLSNFFQTSELTASVSRPWPDIVFWTLPLAIPMTDAKCLASSFNLTETVAFFAIIYVPIFFFLIIYATYRCQPKNSPYRLEVAHVVTFLLTTWYSPGELDEGRSDEL